MADEDTGTATANAAAEAAFGGGFPDTEPKTTPEKPAKDKPEAAATPRTEDKPEPKYVQVTEAEWAEVRAAAAKTASYDQQLSKAFGTIGNLAKQIAEQKAAGKPAEAAATARKFEVPKEAFAAMERDFPELAQQTRAALEAALSGIPVGASDADPAKLESLLDQYTAKREVKMLEAAFPTWRDIVGAVGVGEQPDPANPFRKWLSGKPADYQDRVNSAESADAIGRAIRLFQRETAAPAKPTATRDTARAERIRSAIQPRGDNGGAAASNTAEDAFAAGYGR